MEPFEIIFDMPKPERHLVVVSNPNATTASEMGPKLDEIKGLDYWDSVAHINTEPDGSHEKELHENIRTNSKVVIAGGDGTVKRTIDSLECFLEDYKYRGIEFIIAGAGNKNDIAHMLNGDHYNDPLAVLESGKKQKIYPIEAVLTSDDGEKRTERALYSFSIGITATAAGLFNNADFRERQKARGPKGQWIGEQMLALRSIIRTPIIRTQTGRALDITVAAGQRMAGGALKFPTSLFDPNELIIARTKPNLPSLIGNIIGRKIRVSPDDMWVSGHHAIAVQSDVPAQADGEVIGTINAGTIIRLQRARRGIPVLSLSLRDALLKKHV